MVVVASDPPDARGDVRLPRPTTLPAGTVTFLFTDIEGSTRLLRQLGPRYAAVLQRHREIVRTAVAEAGGVEVRADGDGFFFAFGGAVAAVMAAVAAQLGLDAESWPSDGHVRVRMGLHTGEGAPWDGDYVAMAVHQAARVAAAANGRQVLVTDATVAATAEALPPGVSTRDLGPYHLKDFDAPCHLHQLCHATLPVELPELRVERASMSDHRAGTRPAHDAPSHDTVVIPLPARLATAAQAPLVGRSDELERLLAAWSSCAPGRRRLVTITGAAGMGKSRLAAELAVLAHASGATVLHGHSDEEPPWPFQPFAEALNEHVRVCPADALPTDPGGIAADLVRLVPTWHEHAHATGEPMRSEPETERYRLFESVELLLAAAMRRAPMLLVLDDIQWADDPSLLLLAHLLRHPDPGALLVVATFRDDAVPSRGEVLAWQARLARDGLADVLELRGLGDTEVSQLLHLTTPGHAWARFAGVLEWLCRTTEGNPFFVREMTRHLIDTEFPLARGGVGLDGVTIPSTIRQLLGRRLDRLSKDAHVVVTLGAVIGREFDTSLLELTGLLPDAQFDALDEAVTSRILEEVPGRPDQYRFAHELILQAVYSGLTSNRRARLHLRVAEALAAPSSTRPAAPAATLARHFCSAAPLGGLERAVDHARRAGDEALGNVAAEEAIVHYQRGLDVLLLDVTTAPRPRYDLVLRLARAQATSGQRAESRGSVARAMQLATELDDPMLLADAALAPDGHGLSMGLVDEDVVTRLEQALHALPSGDSAQRSQLLARLAGELFFSSQQPRIRTLTEDALAIAERISDPRSMAAALAARHLGLLGPDGVEERITVATRLIEFAADAADPHQELIGRGYRLVDHLEAGDLTAADDDLARYTELATKVRRPRDLWMSVVLGSMRAQLDGRFAECETLAADAVNLGARLGMPDAEAIFAVQVFAIRWQQGRLAELRSLVDDLVATSPTIPAWRCALALVHAELGHVDEARTQLDLVADGSFTDLPRDWLWLPTITTAAQVCYEVGATEHAEAVYELLLPYARRQVVVGAGFGCLGSASRFLGLLARRLGNEDRADAHLVDAIEENDRMGATPWAALARCDLAASRLQRGDRPGAGTLAENARDVGRRLGMARLVAQADDVLAEM